METTEQFTAGRETFIHPSALSREQRRANIAAMHDRAARAMERAGGISATRDAPVARAAAKRLREAR